MDDLDIPKMRAATTYPCDQSSSFCSCRPQMSNMFSSLTRVSQNNLSVSGGSDEMVNHFAGYSRRLMDIINPLDLTMKQHSFESNIATASVTQV
jgi:hypothetical protein